MVEGTIAAVGSPGACCRSPPICDRAHTRHAAQCKPPPRLTPGRGRQGDKMGDILGVCDHPWDRWVATRRALSKPISSSPPFKTGLAVE